MNDLTEMKARHDYLAEHQAKTDAAVKTLLDCQMYKGDTDGLESLLMKLPLDYEGALSIVKTLQAKLEQRYDHCGVDGGVLVGLMWLKQGLEKAEEPEPDPKAGEDEYLDDNRRW